MSLLHLSTICHSDLPSSAKFHFSVTSLCRLVRDRHTCKKRRDLRRDPTAIARCETARRRVQLTTTRGDQTGRVVGIFPDRDWCYRLVNKYTHELLVLPFSQCIVSLEGVPPPRKHLDMHMKPSNGPNTAIKKRPEHARRSKRESGES
jgi:hypothetical protein